MTLRNDLARTDPPIWYLRNKNLNSAQQQLSEARAGRDACSLVLSEVGVITLGPRPPRYWRRTASVTSNIECRMRRLRLYIH